MSLGSPHRRLLESVPRTWTLRPLGSVVMVVSGATPSKDNPEFWSGSIPWVSPKDMKVPIIADSEDHISEAALLASPLKLVDPPAVLLVIRGMILAHTVPVALTASRVTLNQDMKALRPRAGVHARFLAYQLRALGPVLLSMVEEAGHGTRCLRTDLWRKLMIAVPSEAEQLAIADFLDRKTAAISALVEKKEHLVATAEERRAALIGEVVLGARSAAPRRNTGTPLGAIPEHWAAKRLMHLTAPGRPIMYGIVLPGPNVDDGVRIVKSGNCTRETLRPELLHKTTFEIEAGYARSRLAEADIVYAIRGSVGMAALVPPDVAGANVTQDAARIAPSPDVNPRWLLYAVQSAPVWAQLAAGIVGATVKGINIRDLKRPFVPVPPRREQDEIAAYLDAEIGKLHELEAATTQSIERLREYRQALVTAAVTGQLDVAAQEAA